MKKRARRSPFTLIEAVLSFGLLACLLAALFGIYHHLSYAKVALEKQFLSQLETRYLSQRLERILPKSFVSEKEISCFYSDGYSLIFTFDQGPYLLPDLSNRVLGRLYHDPLSETLYLGIWPLPDEEREIKTPALSLPLADHISECHFSFYAPPNHLKLEVDPGEVGKETPIEGWQPHWKQEYHTLPAIVKIALVKNKEEDFYIEIPQTIVYRGDM